MKITNPTKENLEIRIDELVKIEDLILRIRDLDEEFEDLEYLSIEDIIDNGLSCDYFEYHHIVKKLVKNDKPITNQIVINKLNKKIKKWNKIIGNYDLYKVNSELEFLYKLKDNLYNELLIKFPRNVQIFDNKRVVFNKNINLTTNKYEVDQICISNEFYEYIKDLEIEIRLTTKFYKDRREEIIKVKEFIPKNTVKRYGKNGSPNIYRFEILKEE